MKKSKTYMHIAAPYLINPTNPIKVILIGAGGTGSHMLTALAKTNHALTALGHAGLQVHLWDDDRVTDANIGRQLFAEAEIGLYKSVALINRVNRFFGTSWKAVSKKFAASIIASEAEVLASIYISCVDKVDARFEIANIISKLKERNTYILDTPLYWMDTGNSKFTGQTLLSTIGEMKQPTSKKFSTVGLLPMVTDEYTDQLKEQVDNDEPSCSLAEALAKQDLFINPAIADLSASLLWQLFREGMTENRGFFINIKDLRSQPIKVSPPVKLKKSKPVKERTTKRHVLPKAA